MPIKDKRHGGRWFQLDELHYQRERIVYIPERRIRRRFGYLLVRFLLALGLFLVLLTIWPWWCALIVSGTTATIVVQYR